MIPSDPPDAAPAADDSREDLHVFSVKKGEALGLPVAAFKVVTKDAYAVEIPVAPPGDVQAQWAAQDPTGFERLFRAPKTTDRILPVN